MGHTATPESQIKGRVSAMLKKYGVYYFMPVQQGYGAAGLDYHCVVKVNGMPIAFFIETKRTGGKTTARQDELIGRLRRDYRVNVFVIDGYIGLGVLEDWLKKVGDTNAPYDNT
jgi:hypothetical protein